MPTNNLLIAGAGGHCGVVIDTLLSSFCPFTIHIADDSHARWGQKVLGFKVVGSANASIRPGWFFHVAVGENSRRHRLFEDIRELGGVPVDIVHPSAYISSFASIGTGSFVAARSIIGPLATVGEGVIVNHGAVVDHDCTIGHFTHIAPNATIAGGSQIGNRVLIGSGANVIAGVSIGDDVTVGAGAVVLHHVPPGEVVAGVPARSLRRRSR